MLRQGGGEASRVAGGVVVIRTSEKGRLPIDEKRKIKVG